MGGLPPGSDLALTKLLKDGDAKDALSQINMASMQLQQQMVTSMQELPQEDGAQPPRPAQEGSARGQVAGDPETTAKGQEQQESAGGEPAALGQPQATGAPTAYKQGLKLKQSNWY